MILNLDASALVSMFCEDTHTPSVRGSLSQASGLTASDFAAAEFGGAVARLHRTGLLDREAAEAVFRDFDQWCSRRTVRAASVPADIDRASRLVRRLDLGLRAPDALNIAIAERPGAWIPTFDRRMAEASIQLGLHVMPT